MPPELQGRFSTSGPPGKPRRRVLKEADPGPQKAEWGVMCFTLEEVASAVGLKESIDIYPWKKRAVQAEGTGKQRVEGHT